MARAARQRRVAIWRRTMLMSEPMRRSTGSARRTQGILGGRSEQVLRRALDAAMVELARSGYAGFRMERVASRAAVNKTTIYRRWPSRLALVTALVDRMRTPLRESPLPDTGQLESDLVEAFTRRFTFGRKAEGRAWARLLDERHNPEVEAMIGDAVDERRGEWRSMVTRAIDRDELPPGTEAQLVLDLVRAIVDDRVRSSSRRLDTTWLTLAVRTVIAGARAGTLLRGPTTRRSRRPAAARGGDSRKPG
jgi:AcrR family transcriptional regulator